MIKRQIEVDDRLLQEALELEHESNPDQLIHQALEEYIRYHKQLKILELFGTIDYSNFE